MQDKLQTPTITPLREVPPEQAHVRETIEMLARAMAAVRDHHAFGCLVLLELPGGELWSGYTASVDCVRRLGALELLKADWIRAWGQEQG